MSRRPAILSIASGKGGVGKTTVAVNLAVAAVRRGFSTVLVDTDIGGADAHLLLGELQPERTLTDFLERRVGSLQEASVACAVEHRLRLVAGTGESLKTANLSYATKQRLARNLAKLDADLVIVDVGAGTSFHALDFFLLGTQRLVLTTPEPTAVMDAYRFVKLASVRHVLKGFLARDGVSKALSERHFQSTAELIAVASEVDPDAAARVEEALSDFEVSLLVNQAGAGNQLNANRLALVLKEYVGGRFRFLGHLPLDPAVGRAVSRYRPVVVDGPGSAIARGLFSLVDSVMAQADLDVSATG